MPYKAEALFQADMKPEVTVVRKTLRSLLVFIAVTVIATMSVLITEPASAFGNSRSKFADSYNSSDNWLIYWYLCGTDLETESGYGTDDLLEMLDVKLPPNVKVLIQTGGTLEWQNNVIAQNKIGRYLYDENGLYELDVLPDEDMGTRETLADFIRYGNENFSPDHKIFLFWDHGGGSVSGVCYDEISDKSLSLNDIREAFKSVHQPSADNPPFELIGFDACLMATYDTANSLYGLSRYMTASQETEPSTGWDYKSWLGALAENPAMGGAAIGQEICDSYYNACKVDDSAEYATLSVIDLSKIPELRTSYEKFGVEALRHSALNPTGFFSIFGRSAEKAENYGGNTRDQGYTNMVDISDLARKSQILLPETSKELINAVDNAVIYKVQGPYRDKGSGLSGFYSYDNDEESFKDYAAIDSAPLSIKCLFYHLIYGDIPAEGKALLDGHIPDPAAPSTMQSIYGKKSKLFNIAALENMPVDIDNDGYAFVRLNDKEMDLLSTIHCQLIYMDPNSDVILNLGSDTDIIADWDSGLFKDNFRGVWPMLDGHPIYIEINAETDDYNLYSVPIKLNGKECNLQVVYDFTAGKYSIIGARKGLSNMGMGDKNLVKLKKGDKITTIHYAMTYSGDDEEYTAVEAETFTIGNNPQIRDEELGDGKYGYFFEFITPADENAFSELIEFTLSNGEITTSVGNT